MKKIILIIFFVLVGLVLYPTALNLNSSNNDIEILLSKSLSSKKMSALTFSLKRNVFNEINNKKVNYDLLSVKFLSVHQLLAQKTDNFYTVNIKFEKNEAKVLITYFKSGILYVFDYKKINGVWKEINTEWGRIKPEPSKPYYIYWEVIRLKNPNYMNFKAFKIPKDSLK